MKSFGSRLVFILLLLCSFESLSSASIDRYAKKATALYRKGQYEKALKYVERALKDEQSAKLYMMQARILVKLQRYNEAVRALDRAENVGQATLKLLVLRSRCLLAQGLRGQAQRDAERACALAPQSKKALALMRKFGMPNDVPKNEPVAKIRAAEAKLPISKEVTPVESTGSAPKSEKKAIKPTVNEQTAIVLPQAKKVGVKVKLPFDIELAYIPPGSFEMGWCASSGQECPAHKVTLTKGFWIGVHEVTQGQWTSVMGDNPSQFKGSPDLPVEAMTYEQCQEFCSRLSRKIGLVVRLPTEAEWEYAARAGTTGPCYGRPAEISWNKKNSGGKTQPVGKKKANAWGLYDTLGNVYELCGNVWYKYTKDPVVDPVGPSEGFVRAYRGGSVRFGFNTVTSRYQMSDGVAKSLVGFRIVLAEEEKLPQFRPKPKPQKGPDGDKVLAAAKKRRWSDVRKLVEGGADITKCDDAGYNVLHLAAQARDVDTIALLLKKGADYNQPTRFCKTPLYIILDGWQLAMPAVRMLVEAGANVNFNAGGCYPLKAAAFRNHSEAVKYLLENGAKIDVKMTPESPLHVACNHGCVDSVLTMARSKIETELRDFKKRTPLISAADSHTPDDEKAKKMCDYLLSKGAAVNAIDEDGASALHHAAYRNRPLTVAFLLKWGANSKLKDKKGKTALDYARKFKKRNPRKGDEVIKILESH